MIYSGNSALEKAHVIRDRGVSRSQGIELMLLRTQYQASELVYGFNTTKTLLYNQDEINLDSLDFEAANKLVGRLAETGKWKS